MIIRVGIQPRPERNLPGTMTVCIVSKTRDDGFVVVMDAMLTVTYDAGAELAGDARLVKSWILDGGWHALAAGDMAMAEAVMLRAEEEIYSQKRQDRLTRAEIERIIETAYREQRSAEVAQRILMPRRVSWDEFKEGISRGRFRRLEREVVKYNLGVELIILGVDGRFLQHLFWVGNPGVLESRDMCGYWAIGSGSQFALNALQTGPSPPLLPRDIVIYRLCEAKFHAECDRCVGRVTTIILVDSVGGWSFIPTSSVDRLRSLQRLRFTNPIPAEAIEIIRQEVSQHRTL
jgi:ATP-dependent protease HslVU (ClpYQ) peptidase subunit